MPSELQNTDDDQALVRGWLVNPATATGIHLADEADGWQFRSYAELAELTWSVAGRLRERGLGGDDEAGVCVVMPTGFPCVAAFYAVWACGGVFTPIAAPMFADMAQYVAHVAAILDQAAPRVVVTSVELETLVREAMTTAGRADEPVVVGETGSPADRTLAPAAAETALLQFTSGSTGTPRGVRVSWHNLANNIRMISRLIDWRPGEAMVSWLPLYHDMGLVGAFLTTVANQGDLYLMRPDQFVRDPARWLRAMAHAQHSPSPSFALGYVAHRVSPDDIADLDLSGWRTLAVGSEPVEVEDLRSFAELTGARGFSARAYTLAYGLAEATLMVTSSARDRPLTALRVDTATLRPGEPVRIVAEVALADDRWVSGPGWITGLGYSTPESTVVVVDEDGRELPDGVLGEMVVIGDSVALGYTDGAGGATRITDGRLYTGDAGFRYQDEVFVLGRMGTSLKVRGRSVFMEDIESRVARETGITKGKLAAVSLTGGAVPGIVLFAETAPGEWVTRARTVVRGELGPAGTVGVVTGPRGFIRRTSSGKPRRRHMWQLYTEGRLAGATEHPGADTAATSGSTAPSLSLDRVERLLGAALETVSIPPNSAALFEGSLAEGFGNEGSDIDFLIVAPGDEEMPTLPTVVFADGRRIEIRTRSEAQLRAQLERVTGAGGDLDEDVLNRCQRFRNATVVRSSAVVDLDGLLALLPADGFAETVSGWWARRSRHALWFAVALRAMGADAESDGWARDGLLQAVKSWAATRGETYIETKWIPRQLDRIVADPDIAEQVDAYRALPAAATLDETLTLARRFGIDDVTDDPDRILLARVDGVTTWPIGDRIHVLRDDRDVFALSDRGAAAWRGVVARKSVADILRRSPIGAELAEFVRLGFVGLSLRGGETLRPALAMCKPVRPVTPIPSTRMPALGLAGGGADREIATLSPLPAQRFVACAMAVVWSNVVLENAREDLMGAVKAGQGAVADIAAHRVIAMCVRMTLSTYGIHPLPPDVAPGRTLAAMVPDAGPLRALVDRASAVRFSAVLGSGASGLDELAVLDELAAAVREIAGGTQFPASFDSREQWRRTLDISYDWLRPAAYLDTELPLDEARDLLGSGGRQPHQRDGGQ
ncbi:Long-chain-fatty-acid--AMP ligase FadD29 [Nocardia cerradoensis]|uniref:Long-chain-fatty-acid--AMP ligase FadD29 n=1 Tax=Nocardia cerradoensis TaxID=85688 RepID=A0A231HEN3_9NOCA|nr:AMP-binding protein [Nocardia cerradoensis]OXR47176.1 Long-chain-fatty-acid--AMP ligase FadD29 [Nocardia cerradoensis]